MLRPPDHRRRRWLAGLLLPLVMLIVACTPTGSPGAKLYRRHCSKCHGADGGGGIQYQADSGANLLDETWKHGAGRAAFERVLEEELVFEHPLLELDRQEIQQLVDYLLELRGE